MYTRSKRKIDAPHKTASSAAHPSNAPRKRWQRLLTDDARSIRRGAALSSGQTAEKFDSKLTNVRRFCLFMATEHLIETAKRRCRRRRRPRRCASAVETLQTILVRRRRTPAIVLGRGRYSSQKTAVAGLGCSSRKLRSRTKRERDVGREKIRRTLESKS